MSSFVDGCLAEQCLLDRPGNHVRRRDRDQLAASWTPIGLGRAAQNSEVPVTVGLRLQALGHRPYGRPLARSDTATRHAASLRSAR